MKTYTCPMHPEVKSDRPGKCPKCGMTLVEEVMDHTSHHAHMGHSFKKLFYQTLPITVIVLLLSPSIQNWFNYSLNFAGRDIVLFLLGSVVALYGGRPFFSAAKSEITSRNFGMMTLVSLAVLSGYTF